MATATRQYRIRAEECEACIENESVSRGVVDFLCSLLGATLGLFVCHSYVSTTDLSVMARVNKAEHNMFLYWLACTCWCIHAPSPFG